MDNLHDTLCLYNTPRKSTWKRCMRYILKARTRVELEALETSKPSLHQPLSRSCFESRAMSVSLSGKSPTLLLCSISCLPTTSELAYCWDAMVWKLMQHNLGQDVNPNFLVTPPACFVMPLGKMHLILLRTVQLSMLRIGSCSPTPHSQLGRLYVSHPNCTQSDLV